MTSVAWSSSAIMPTNLVTASIHSPEGESVARCWMALQMHLSTILWLAGGAFVIGVIAMVVVLRRDRPGDFGSVSTAWTTEHNASYHGTDGSANP